jgi:hypothetical protein
MLQQMDVIDPVGTDPQRALSRPDFEHTPPRAG